MKVVKVSKKIFKIQYWFGFTISIWVLRDPLTDQLWIIDTGLSIKAKQLGKQLDKMGVLGGIILTHGHSDHAGGVDYLSYHYNVPVFINKREIPYTTGELIYSNARKPQFIVKKTKLHPLTECQTVLKRLGLTAISASGHTLGHTVFFDESDKVLIAGDLFTSKGPLLRLPMKAFTGDMIEALNSGENVIDQYQPSVISVCHGSEVKEPASQFQQLIKEHPYILEA